MFGHIAPGPVRSATTAVAGTVLAVLAMAPGPASASGQAPYSRPCFIAQPQWNVALDGAVPLCPGRGPSAGSATTPALDGLAGDNPGLWVGGPARVR